ncbi:fructose-1,6-bisphosphate aldolase, class II [Dolosigranulum pigrum]|jgi:fructose-1,6-bisphosphate aldolase, class II|uniref:Fructose-1,6-bisphosphate aldolase, class II n=3 Tax=Dolosigranulum TaxID=29393 RepID=H3NC72_9LACT|nr:class II fructose-1,6-bisphosphate aldolase [Dolosigranulum pigrum]EHR35305.1 fructose-1,6-bisphosphate aldolase, class II [Dolosigranulum pigrum ATCC 51524]OOL81917.1 fructose-1,6-bisphosphate aldolase, class II [Dolosigranulum pigrum]QDO90893.1 class II fructose-1,6-bisphosphate aldolase [Dolosigranulum pigrum]QJS96965.1 class II fructose-1,6-bisphosphate aldolase [Dolosigranulum pigrum]QJS97766.1 class II fructose-1,6-bisphosphate aldolase [Dolosigranulum pigrum]
MGLVNMTDMLNKALEGGYAVGQFNINNLEWTQAILDAVEEANSPAILGVSEGAAKYMGGFKAVVGMVKGQLEERNISQPVAIHLDHGSSLESCRAAIDAGFTSVMIDNSKFPIEENIANTREVVEYAHSKGASVEAEIGSVGGTEDGVTGGVIYADPEECKRIVEEAKIDALAAALGSVHGDYDGEPKLGFDEMKEISELTGAPLVLHGGSGIPEHQIKKAIEYGHSKINVNTELQQVWAKKTREVIANNPDQYDPRKIIGPGKEDITKATIKNMEIFGSAGQG